MSQNIPKIELDTSFIKIGNQVFTLHPATHPIVDAEKMLTKYANNKVKEVCKDISESVVAEAREEMGRQTQRIDEWIRTKDSKVLLPESLESKMCMHHNREWMELHTFTYSPTRIRCTLSGLAGKITTRVLYSKMVKYAKDNIEDVTDTETLDFYVKSPLHFPAVYGITTKNIRLYVFGVRGFHNYGDGSTCTGNMPAKDIKALDYEKAVAFLNSVNTFSMASGVIQVDGEDAVTFTDYLTGSTLESITREAVWTARRRA